MKKKIFIISLLVCFSLVNISVVPINALSEESHAKETDLESNSDTNNEKKNDDQELIDDELVDLTNDGDNIEQEQKENDVTDASDEDSASDTQGKDVISDVSIRYDAHVQNKGWQATKKDGETSGTIGEALRLEAIRINKEGNLPSGNIEYSSHVEKQGWQNWVKNGELSGTVGKELRVEALRIRLTGELAEKYDVYYRAHSQSFGWLGWAKNDENAGTAGLNYRLEAVEIKLVVKGDSSLEDGSESFKSRKVVYETHIQKKGWQAAKKDGEIAGSIGEGLRLEAIRINKDKNLPLGNIEYSSHVEKQGWQNWVKNGELSGTVGKELRVEALRIKLTGELAEKYDVYYRAHSQSYGWLGWAKNGENAGTSGLNLRLEAVEIKLVAKGDSSLEDGNEAFKSRKVVYETHIQKKGWQAAKKDGDISGTIGEELRIEAFRINIDNNLPSGNIEYSSHVEKQGWQNWVKNGELSGTVGKELRVEALRIKLTGELAEKYDVYYRVHSQKFGWLGWAKNGENAGTSAFSYRVEAMQIQLIEKGKDIPDTTNVAYYDGIECNSKSKSITTISDISLDNGSFRVQVQDVQSFFSVDKVELNVWCNDNKKDVFKYTLNRQDNGVYTFKVDLKNHGYHNGKYKVETYIKTKYDLSMMTNYETVDAGIINYSTAEYIGNGHVKLIYSNVSNVKDVNVAITSKKDKNDKENYKLNLDSDGAYSTIVDGRSFKNRGSFDYIVKAIELHSENQLVSTGVFNIDRVNYTPVYYSQKDPRWQNKWYGGYQFGPTGCNPTSIAMTLSALSNKLILPTQVADLLYKTGMYNNAGAGAGSLAVKYAVEYFGYRSDAIKSHGDLVKQLQMNKIVCGAVGRGIFVNGNYTHEIVLYGYSNGKTYVRDPLSERMNGWYNVTDIWNQQSKDPYDMKGGAVFYSAYD